MPLGIPRISTSQIDASWIDNGNVSGLEWSLKDQMDSEALHAEMKSLLWETSCIRDKRITLNCFETDCSNLVDMTTNLMYWPSLATEIEVL